MDVTDLEGIGYESVSDDGYSEAVAEWHRRDGDECEWKSYNPRKEIEAIAETKP